MNFSCDEVSWSEADRLLEEKQTKGQKRIQFSPHKHLGLSSEITMEKENLTSSLILYP